MHRHSQRHLQNGSGFWSPQCGAELRHLRETHKRWSQRLCAEELGPQITPRIWGLWETGKSKPHLSEIRQIETMMDVPAGYFKRVAEQPVSERAVSAPVALYQTMHGRIDLVNARLRRTIMELSQISDELRK